MQKTIQYAITETLLTEKLRHLDRSGIGYVESFQKLAQYDDAVIDLYDSYLAAIGPFTPTPELVQKWKRFRSNVTNTANRIAAQIAEMNAITFNPFE